MKITFLFFILGVLPFLLIIFILVFVINSIRGINRRSEERLKLEKENLNLQQNQIQELTNRLTKIENILKEVD